MAAQVFFRSFHLPKSETAMKKLLLAGIALNLSMAGTGRADVTIGLAAPMTGSSAAFGEQFRIGAEQAVADINAEGGVNGEKLQLMIGDDACDPKQAVAVANQFAAAGVPFVAGHFCSGSSIPASQVYADEEIVQISPASTNPDFSDKRPGKGIFRVCGRDDQQGQVAAEYILKNYPGARIAVIDDKTAWGKGITDALLTTLRSAGHEPAYVTSYTAGEKDFSSLATRLKSEKIDVLFAGGYYTEVGLITRQMREQSLDAVVMGGDAIFTNDYWAITGDAGTGTKMTFAPDPRKNERAKAVVEELEADGKSAEGYALYTYAAIQTWADAAEKAGTTDFEPVVEALGSGSFETVIGDVSFDEHGDVNLPGFVVYEWRNGTYDYAGGQSIVPVR
jgi:branched-chain amino acid transport system substrate-binding protein